MFDTKKQREVDDPLGDDGGYSYKPPPSKASKMQALKKKEQISDMPIKQGSKAAKWKS